MMHFPLNGWVRKAMRLLQNPFKWHGPVLVLTRIIPLCISGCFWGYVLFQGRSINIERIWHYEPRGCITSVGCVTAIESQLLVSTCFNKCCLYIYLNPTFFISVCSQSHSGWEIRFIAMGHGLNGFQLTDMLLNILLFFSSHFWKIGFYAVLDIGNGNSSVVIIATVLTASNHSEFCSVTNEKISLSWLFNVFLKSTLDWKRAWPGYDICANKRLWREQTRWKCLLGLELGSSCLAPQLLVDLCIHEF